MQGSGDNTLMMEVRLIRKRIVNEEHRARDETRQTLFELYNLALCIAASDKLQAELKIEHDARFNRHPRTTWQWGLIKLCTIETRTPVSTAHRWSQTIEIAQANGWDHDQFVTKLKELGIDGILRLAPKAGARSEPALDPAGMAVLVELDSIQTSHLPIDSGEAEPYLLLAVRSGDRLKVTGCLKLTDPLRRAIAKARKAEMPTQISDARGQTRRVIDKSSKAAKEPASTTAPS